MGSNKIIVGDAVADKPVKTLATTGKAFIKYPHGIAVHGGIDRMLVTSTVRASDLGDAGGTVTEIEASSGKVLATHKVAGNPAKGKAPVEILFLPRSNPPRAYITNMFGGTLLLATWSPGKKIFSVKQVFDLSPHKAGVPLEMYFNEKGERLYLTTANPGAFHIIDIKNPEKPRMLKTIPAAGGAHHAAFDKGGKYAFVQNNLLAFKGMNDGSITVIDMKKESASGASKRSRTGGFSRT